MAQSRAERVRPMRGSGRTGERTRPPWPRIRHPLPISDTAKTPKTAAERSSADTLDFLAREHVELGHIDETGFH